MATRTEEIKPGSTILFWGGGQLGKMGLIAAHQLGYHTAVWAPPGDNPAMEMATHRIEAPFDDEEAFARACELADVGTTEWENIPVPLLRRFEDAGKLVRPSSRVLAVAQSRRAEKEFAQSLDARPVPWLPILSEADQPRDRACGSYGEEILKTDRLGYDGKGQIAVSDYTSLASAFETLKRVPCVLEQRISLAQEISVLVARNARGHVQVSPAVQNRHEGGILRETTWFDGIAGAYEREAQNIAISAAYALELEGILAIEFFVSMDGELFFNEMAPRPHNSFHGSIEAGVTNQFTALTHAICGLPLGRLDFHTEFVMRNLIGGSWEEDWRDCLNEENAHLHLYGKAESRPGRKMGHVTVLG